MPARGPGRAHSPGQVALWGDLNGATHAGLVEALRASCCYQIWILGYRSRAASPGNRARSRQGEPFGRRGGASQRFLLLSSPWEGTRAGDSHFPADSRRLAPAHAAGCRAGAGAPGRPMTKTRHHPRLKWWVVAVRAARGMGRGLRPLDPARSKTFSMIMVIPHLISCGITMIMVAAGGAAGTISTKRARRPLRGRRADGNTLRATLRVRARRAAPPPPQGRRPPGAALVAVIRVAVRRRWRPG